MNNHDPNNSFEELCAGYVLHSLNDEDQKAFEAMLAQANDEQRQLYQEMWAAANQLSFTIEGSEPPADIKEKLMSRIRTESIDTESKKEEIIVSDYDNSGDNAAVGSEEEGFNRPALTLAASIALLIICLTLIFYSFNLSSQLNQKEEEIAEQQEIISELQTDIQQKNDLLSVLESRETKIMSLSGLESNPDGYGKIIFNSESDNALLQVSNMPPVPEDSVYQLWVISNNNYFSAGVFFVDTGGEGFFKMEQINGVDESAEAFSVTMEPKGGSPQPTGDTFLMGNVTQ